MVYADELVVCARRKVAAIGRESHGVDCAKVVAHVAELSRFRGGFIVGVVYRLGRPDSHMAICAVSVSASVSALSWPQDWRVNMGAYRRQLSQVSTRRERHGSCRLRSPSVRLSQSKTERQHLNNGEVIGTEKKHTSMAKPSRLNELHADELLAMSLDVGEVASSGKREGVEIMAMSMSIKKSRLRRAWIATDVPW